MRRCAGFGLPAHRKCTPGIRRPFLAPDALERLQEKILGLEGRDSMIGSAIAFIVVGYAIGALVHLALS